VKEVASIVSTTSEVGIQAGLAIPEMTLSEYVDFGWQIVIHLTVYRSVK